jgi:hypothetical protein
MYAMKVISSFVFRMMMFPHNGKIITIKQITHYEPNHSANIDNILPLVLTSSYDCSLIDMGPNIFKNPSLLGAYHGAPPLLHPSTQVCVVYSNETDIESNTPPIKVPPHIKVPPVEELLPQNLPENPDAPLISYPPPPPPPSGENPSFGDSPSNHYPNSLLLPPTWSPIFLGSCNSYSS